MTYMIRQVQLRISEQANGEDLLFQRGDRPAKFDGVDDLAEVRAEKSVLTLPVVNQDLMVGSSIAVGRILYLETNSELEVRLDDVGDTGVVVKPVVAAEGSTKRGTLYLEGEFSHVYVSIGGTGSAIVWVGIVGQ